MRWMVICTLVIMLASACREEPPPPDVEIPPPPTIYPIQLIQDQFEGRPVILIGSEELNFVVSYYRDFNFQVRNFTLIDNQFPRVMTDNKGNIYDLWGRVVDGVGEDLGKALTPTRSTMGYFFAFASMYPGLDIFGGSDIEVNIDPEIPEDWTIPDALVFRDSTRNKIQALEDLDLEEFISRNYTNEAFFVNPEDLVMLVRIDNTFRVYPHRVLDWHEIANDTLAGEAISVVYCPLTGTGTVWSRETSAGLTTFGISEYLYNNNILAFDLSTNSLWSQLRYECVNGSLIGEQASSTAAVMETTWETVTTLIERPVVMTDQTGYALNYAKYPYDDYKTSNTVPNPLLYDDDRLPRKERVHAIMGEGAKVYRLSDFD